MILGGDFNRWRGREAGSRHIEVDRLVLERVKSFGLVDCLEAMRGPGRLEGCPCSFADDCVRYRPVGAKAEWPIGEPYIPKKILGRLEAATLDVLRLTITWCP